MGAAPDLRPRTVGELLDAAFFVYRRYFGRLLMVATIVSIPALVVAGVTAEDATNAFGDYLLWLLDSVQNPNPDFAEHMAESFEHAQQMNVYSMLGYVMQSLARGGGYAAMALVGWAAVCRTPMPGAIAIVKASLPRIPAVVASQMVVSVFAGCLACCIPLWVIALALVLPLPAVIMLERGPMEAGLRKHIDGDPETGRAPLPVLFALPMRWIVLPGAMVIDGMVRSITLSWHGFTIARGSLFLFFLVSFVSFFVAAISAGVAALLNSWPAVFWLQHYAEVVFLPILGLSATFWYFDVRTRREGLDLAPPEMLDSLLSPVAS